MEESRATLLLLEADPALRDLIVLPLEREGFRVIASDRAAEAPALIRKYKPFLVLLDLFLPHISGLEVLRKIDEGLKTHCFIIVISSLGFREVVEQAREAGARDFLLKPIDPDKMMDKIRRAREDARFLEPWE